MAKDYEMNKNEWIRFNQQKKIDRYYEQYKTYCSCGHSVVMFPNTNRKLCTHCGHFIYRNKLDEFKAKLLEAMR